MSDTVRLLWKLLRPSQEFQDGPVVTTASGKVTLRYDYETRTGTYEWEEAIFSGVVAVLYTAHEFCTEEQIAAYDKLIEVSDSGWLAAVAPPTGSGLAADVRHMRIYFDEIGCLEVLAAGFDPPRRIEPK